MEIPAQPEVEKHIIGGLLLGDPESYKAFDLLSPSHFYLEKHALIFSEMLSLHTRGVEVNLVSLSSAFKASGLLQTVGGDEYLLEIASEVASSAGMDDHCARVREMADRREYIRRGQQLLATAQNTASPMAAVESAAAGVMAELGGGPKTGPLSAKECLVSTIDLIERCHSGQIQGLQTQFPQLNQLTGGLCQTDWIVLAGRPAVGKTAFALDVADYLATDLKKVVLVCSLEMPKEQLMQRLICRREGIDFQALRTGRLPRSSFGGIASAVGALKTSSIFVDDAPNQTPASILTACKRIASAKGRLDLVIVDNLSLMRGDRRSENRLQEVSELTRTFKGFGKLLGATILTLVHLSRAIEHRGEEGIPRMSDLRECGSIEQDADMIFAMHKPDPAATKTDLHILKQRNGPAPAVVPLTAEMQYMRFKPYNGTNFGAA